jgi:hypothetical protein
VVQVTGPGFNTSRQNVSVAPGFHAHNIHGGALAPPWLLGRPRAAEMVLTAGF